MLVLVSKATKGMRLSYLLENLRLPQHPRKDKRSKKALMELESRRARLCYNLILKCRSLAVLREEKM